MPNQAKTSSPRWRSGSPGERGTHREKGGFFPLHMAHHQAPIPTAAPPASEALRGRLEWLGK